MSNGINLREMIGGALVLTTALAWNEAAKTMLRTVAPVNGSGSTAKAALAYAAVVTIIMIVAYYSFHWLYDCAEAAAGSVIGSIRGTAANRNSALRGIATPGLA